MNQLNIFDYLNDDKFTLIYQHGAMYARILDHADIDLVPVVLGDCLLSPGEMISGLGKKKRTSFTLEEGNYLRYCGKINQTLLFSVNDMISIFYYAFHYVDHQTLVIGVIAPT